mmetsp:Transcript_32096/g.31419  ORF Transcript_32096/g.31419 Transcript_32096/m.31419 type:complete len:81 (+) Transcript_32096:1538-1780(+)
MLNPKTYSINDFVPVAVLGSGSFGLVYLVESKKHPEKKYAMKVLDKKKIMQDNIVKYTQTERDILSKISHPFIVELKYAF